MLRTFLDFSRPKDIDLPINMSLFGSLLSGFDDDPFFGYVCNYTCGIRKCQVKQEKEQLGGEKKKINMVRLK